MRALIFAATAAAAIFSSVNSWGAERVRPRALLLAEGYHSVVRSRPHVRFQSLPIPPHSLNWPVAFQDPQHSLRNSMAQFQPFSNPSYFHGGCDLRIRARAEVIAPIDGRIEAGHYSYSTNPDGSMEKFFKPWPQLGDRTYFEIAIVDANNTRFEFHHMDRSAIAPEILKLLNSGGGFVRKGTLLGKAIFWPGGDYHHIHYNVILADGTRVNPEYVSPLISDHQAPTVSRLLAVFQNKVTDFGNGLFAVAPLQFVVAVTDRQDGNIYEHPPAYAAITFADGKISGWDFRRLLVDGWGRFPALLQFFVDHIRTPEGKVLSTTGGYGLGLSLVRLYVPSGARGPFSIVVADQAGNTTGFRGVIQY